MPIDIRPPRPDELSLLEDIENDADALLRDRLDPPTWWPAPTGASRADEAGFLLVADVGAGVIAGFVHVLEVDRHAHLEQLSVSPEHGRRGYGRKLVEAAMTFARDRGHDRMSLRTFADVPWNAPFYERLGFAVTEPRSEFELMLVETEERMGLNALGPRVQMTADLRS
ncbi:N-acetyltransferase [Microbacterium sp. AISO3]|uniref:GNAT superfamily N-acetyltransferase n=1 Tax=Microbacterium paludicola TaxID=300019 RepID=A0ABU1I2G3_9MICO|nr:MULTISPECIES: GNAT family N-acetyltransferase [Microbacterium]APF34532.1 GNAT family N-acetyltransferase [Microbacterium paludicola]MDR6168077.1 GNAT superfamily N-acetyltransferase [Microbacterium paludicola]OWP23357.1 N-acetyltransferase [Microbacterium sp. AISO3]